MADRYWVLGTGTWDAATTTNWSTSSGGSGGASVPTASDNVFFDANSNVGTGAFTVTMATTPRVCNDFTASGLDGTMTLAGTSIGLTVSGSLTFQATNFTRTYTGTTTFDATTTGKTVTTNGVSFGANVIFNGVGGGWTLASALTTSATLTITNGTFDTSSSGNYAITCNLFSSSNVNTRTINLNSSTLTLSGFTGLDFLLSTGLTFNAGTSTINLSNNAPTFRGGDKTFYNVSFTSTAQTTSAILGINTFNNLSITGITAVGINILSIGANQTINGTLTLSAGTAAAYRTTIVSDTIGTQRTLTVNAIASLTDIDFQDIVAAGASGTWSGTRLGDCGGNSNITFPSAKTVYYRQTGSNNWGVSGTGSWSATSGGALDATQFPLAQDTAVFPAATYPASGSTTTINASYNIGTIDMSLRTSNTMTLASNNVIRCCGNWINGSGTTISGIGTIIFTGRSTQQITSSGKSFPLGIQFNNVSGTSQLQDNFTVTSSQTTLYTGTLSLQSFSLKVSTFALVGTNTKAIAFGTGNIECIGTGTVWDSSTVTGFTTTGTQVVNVTSVGSTAITVTPGALSQTNSISFNFTGGTYALTFLATSGHSARNVDFTGYAGTLGAPGSNATIYGNLIFSTGMTLTASANSIVFGATSGTQKITTNTKTLDFSLNFSGVGGTFQLQDALTMGSTRTAQLTNGTLDLFGKTLTVGTAFTTATGTKNLTFNGGTLVCPTASTTAFNNAVPTNFTTTAGTGTGTISMTAATAKTFVGAGSTFNCTLNQGGAGALNITGSNTFSNITNTVQPTSVLFTGGATNTFTNFNLSGTSGNLITIGSITASTHTLSKASGTVNSSYLSISRSAATGGATWNALNSTDGGNNSGWIFSAMATATGNFLVFF